MRVLAVTLLCAIFPVAATANVYKWVDKNGVTHYSQTPPNNQKSTTVTIHKQKLDPAAESPSLPQHATEKLTSVTLSGGTLAGEVDCKLAINNIHSSINAVMGESVYDTPGMTANGNSKQNSSKLLVAKANATEKDCESASGADKDFYHCMAHGGGDFLACSNHFKP